MCYYVNNIYFMKPANKMCEELAAYMMQFRNMLLVNQETMDTLVADIKNKVKKLGEKYPKCKPLDVHVGYFTGVGISVYPVGRSDQPVATLHADNVAGAMKVNECGKLAIVFDVEKGFNKMTK